MALAITVASATPIFTNQLPNQDAHYTAEEDIAHSPSVN